MLNGTFALKYFYGGSFKQWEWDDKSILNTAWNTPKFSYGHAFVKYDDDRGVKRFKPTHYEVGRFGNRILALWGSTIETPTRVYPLFEPLRSKEVTVARGPNTSNHQMLPSLSAIAYPLTR